MTPDQAFAEAMKQENRWNPYPFFDELRKTPVVRLSNGLCVVTGYREVIALGHDPRVSSDLRKGSLFAKSGETKPTGDTPEASAEMTEKYGREPSMITSDPPEHDRTRRQAMRHFGPPHSPDVIPGMAPLCVQVVNEWLDKAKAAGKTRIDVVDEYAYPLPVAVICRVLGVPLEDEAQFHIWIADFFAGLDLGPEAATEEGKRRKEKGQAAFGAFRNYIIELIERAEKNPRDGMISQLVHDDGPDGKMLPGEIVVNTALLLVAGHDSTVNTISHCILTLLRNPGSFDMLRRQPDLVPRAIEEVLRLESAVQFFPSRSALADIEIGGTTIPKGSPIFLMYGAGNRDPRHFDNPNRFDLERKEKESLGWGVGIHTCFGGPLARLEVNIALDTFLRRVRNPRLVVDPPPYRPSQVFRGPLHCVVDIDGID
jgi:cytochrome P450